MRRVVVTGMGAITPIGLDVDSFWQSVKKPGVLLSFQASVLAQKRLDLIVKQLLES